MYIPKLDDSLLSVRRIIENGFKVIFGTDGYSIYDISIPMSPFYTLTQPTALDFFGMET